MKHSKVILWGLLWIVVAALYALALPATSSAQTGTPTPTVSPTPFVDAKLILLYRDRTDLLTINADGSTSKTLKLSKGFSALCPAWSPDGRQIAMIGGQTEFGLYTVAAAGGNPRNLLKKPAKNAVIDYPVGVPAWSKNGKSLAYTGQSGKLYIIGANGQTQATLDTLIFYSVDWSPDGQHLVAFAVDKDGKAGIFVLAIDGTQVQSIVALSDADVSFANSSEHFMAHDTVLPRWSPDGSQIAFAQMTDEHVAGVFTIAATGGTPQRISPSGSISYAPAWSSDGKALAYVSELGSERTIVLADLAETGLVSLVITQIGGCPVWKPSK